MRPIDRRMMYEPGTFAFVRVPGLGGAERELHPFSITSSPIDRDLRFSVRMVGTFTRRLASLDAGTPVDVYGPFGGFTPHRFARFRRLVLVGAGIGITPFLGMLNFELSSRDFRRIWLYYVVRNDEDAVFDAEIRQNHLDAESYIDYVLWTTARQGRISAAAIAAEIAPLPRACSSVFSTRARVPLAVRSRDEMVWMKSEGSVARSAVPKPKGYGRAVTGCP